MQRGPLVGLEAEFFVLNQNGTVCAKADELIAKTKQIRSDSRIVREAALNLVELGSLPNPEVPFATQNLLGNLESLLMAAEELNLTIFPLGTFPGTFNPTLRKTAYVKTKRAVLGKNRFLIAGRCAGFHFHLSIPKRFFDTKKLQLKKKPHAPKPESVVHNYNLLIALDPVLTCLMQSSPFYQGTFLGKDSRVIAYRGGTELNYEKGLYAKMPLVGALGAYKSTWYDLVSILDSRFVFWQKAVHENKRPVLTKHGSILDTAWNPVKVNSHGTLEQRGMDMNFPSLMAAAAVMTKYLVKAVYEDRLHPIPSDDGMANPFVCHGKDLLIPPHSFVQKKLQPDSALSGLEDKRVRSNCQNAVRIAKKMVPRDRRFLLEPFEEILQNRQTVSDRLLKEAKKKGWHPSKRLSPWLAQEIAVGQCKNLFKEVVVLRKKIEALKAV